MPLTADDRRNGPNWHLVGQRADGSRLVLETWPSQARAEQRLDVLRGQLEDYVALAVESEVPLPGLVGFPWCQPKQKEPEPMSTATANGSPASPERLQQIKAAAERRKQAADGTPTQRGAGCQIIRNLGPQATWEQVDAEAKRRGVAFTKEQWSKRRYQIFGNAGDKSSPKPAPAIVKPKPLPAPEPEPELEPLPELKPAAAVEPAAAVVPPAPQQPAVNALEAFTELALVVAKLGGIAEARRHLETLEIIEECLVRKG